MYELIQSSQPAHEAGSVTVSVVQGREWKHRKVQEHNQSHIINTWQS